MNDRRRGQALTEFSLVAAVLLLLLFATIEGGRMLLLYNGVNQGARDGARYAMTHPTDSAGIANAARHSIAGVALGQVSVSVTPGTTVLPSGNAANTITVTVSAPYTAAFAFANVTISAHSTMVEEPGCPPSPLPSSTFC